MTYDTIKRPPGPEVQRHFKIHSLGGMKALTVKDVSGAGPDTMYLQGTASSTVRDRHGDTITAGAQAMMLEAAQGMTMWLNHSYDVPEDILGTCEESTLVAATDKDGADCLDLNIRCKIDANNPRAVKTWQHISGGTQLGFSIGGEITAFDFDNENDDGSSWCPPMIINGLELYEISCVGIPANPRAYTRTFVEEMSRGLMRSVARDKNVRDVVMKTYSDRRKAAAADVLESGATFDLTALSAGTLQSSGNVQINLRSALAPDDIEKIKRMLEDSVGDTHLVLTRTLEALTQLPEPIVRGVIAKDGAARCDAGATGDGECILEPHGDDIPHLAEGTTLAAEPSTVAAAAAADPAPPEETHAKVASAMKCLTLSMGHGMCADAMGQTQAAHTLLASILPEHYAFEDDPTDDDVQNALTLTTLSADANALVAQLKTITDELTAKRAELDTISSTATQRAAEVAAAEAKIADLTTEQTGLQKTIDELKATPTGRHTAQAGGSSERAGIYVRRTSTHIEAQRQLGAAVTGQQTATVGDSTLRPV